MATLPMKKMNKSQKKKFKRLESRRKEYELNSKKFGATWILGNKRLGAIK